MYLTSILIFSCILLISAICILINTIRISGKTKRKFFFIDDEGNIKWLFIGSWLVSIIGFLILISFSIYSFSNIISESNDLSQAWSQYGDFIGGVVATFFSLTGVLLLFETLKNQRQEFKKNAESQQKQLFETKYFELIQFHRANISELKYTKFYRNEMQTSEARKVFRVLAAEYIECFHDLKRFLKMYPDMAFLRSDYKKHLTNVHKTNNCTDSIEELALIDIAYCYFFFGVSKESEPFLLKIFINRYDQAFIYKLKYFLQLKPKGEFVQHFRNWEIFLSKDKHEMRKLFEEVYAANPKTSQKRSHEVEALLLNYKLEKYYGGHQHRLGHYFRHLFQSYKFLSLQDFLNPHEKYFYAKTLRAQLSTFEQLMLFVNSLSSLGMRWDYTPEIIENYPADDFKFISRYHLIKNLPGSQYYELKYKRFYSNVKFEFVDDPTYYNP